MKEVRGRDVERFSGAGLEQEGHSFWFSCLSGWGSISSRARPVRPGCSPLLCPSFPWLPRVFWELWWSEWSRSCLGEGAGVRGGRWLRLGCPSQGSLLLAPVWLRHTHPWRGLFWVFLKKGVFISCLLSGNAATTMSSGQGPVVKPPYFWGDHRANNVQTSFPLTNLL